MVYWFLRSLISKYMDIGEIHKIYFVYLSFVKMHGPAKGTAMQGIHKQTNAKYLSNNYCRLCTMVHKAGYPVYLAGSSMISTSHALTVSLLPFSTIFPVTSSVARLYG